MGKQVAALPTAETETSEELFQDGAMGVNDAAKFIGVSRAVLYRLMEKGTIPFAQPAGRRLVPRRSLVRWLASSLTPSAGQ
jgi:excisionase family DNA binding protein